MPAPDVARGEPYIRMVSGRRVYLRVPDMTPRIHLCDLAHNLARIARFTGATKHRYSVAAHCLMVADVIRDRGGNPRDGLLHDVTEAILGDVSSPLKSLLPDYRALEGLWSDALGRRFGFAHGPAVKAADRIAYAVERRALCAYEDEPGGWDIEAHGAIDVPPNTPHLARYVAKPRAIAAWWLAEARRLGVPEVA